MELKLCLPFTQTGKNVQQANSGSGYFLLSSGGFAARVIHLSRIVSFLPTRIAPSQSFKLSPSLFAHVTSRCCQSKRSYLKNSNERGLNIARLTPDGGKKLLNANDGKKLLNANGTPKNSSRESGSTNTQETGRRSTKTTLAVVSGIVTTLIGGSLYGLFARQRFRSSVKSTTLSQEPKTVKQPIDRQEEKEMLRDLITSEPTSSFFVYVGPHKAGKSQAVQEVVKELKDEGVKGVHYILIDKSKLGIRLAKEFGMDNPIVMPGVPKPSAQDDDDKVHAEYLHEVADRLGAAARKEKDGQITTIIIDGVNALLPNRESGTEELLRLIKIAKKHIDGGIIKWILIDSSGLAFDVMHSISASSRLEPIYASDVNEDRSKKYLKNHLRKNPDQSMLFDVNRVYELTGGRVGLLSKAVESSRIVKTQEELEKEILQVSKANVNEVFEDSPRSPEVQQFQLTVLRHLAAETLETDRCIVNRLGRSLKCEVRRRAISELLKNDLIRFTSLTSLGIHSEAVRYLVGDGYGPFSDP